MGVPVRWLRRRSMRSAVVLETANRVLRENGDRDGSEQPHIGHHWPVVTNAWVFGSAHRKNHQKNGKTQIGRDRPSRRRDQTSDAGAGSLSFRFPDLYKLSKTGRQSLVCLELINSFHLSNFQHSLCVN